MEAPISWNDSHCSSFVYSSRANYRLSTNIKVPVWCPKTELISFLEHSPSWGADCSLDRQEIPRLSYNRNIHNRVTKSLSRPLSWVSSSYSTLSHPSSSSCILNVFFPLCLGILSFRFPAKIMYFSHSFHVCCPPYLFLLYYITSFFSWLTDKRQPNAPPDALPALRRTLLVGQI